MAYLDNLLTRNERVLLSARRHPIYVVRQTAMALVGALILWILAVLAVVVLSEVGGIRVDLILALLLVVGSLVPLGIAVYRFMHWWKEQYVITNYRILQIEGLVNRQTFDSALEMVNDVQMNQGMLGRLFNYGTIHILTGSELGVNNIEGVAKPFEFKRALLEAKLSYPSRDERPIDREAREFAGLAGGASMHEQDTSRLHAVADESSDPSRMVVALTELRNAGVISQSEYDEKLRKLMQGQSTARPWDSG